MHLVISCNHKPQSFTRLLAGLAVDELSILDQQVELIDLRDYQLSHEDTSGVEVVQDVRAISEQIAAADSILLATPIYHFDVGSATKQLIEVTGNAWKHKVVGFLCTAANQRGYMSIMGLANSLMLEYRCLIVPYLVFTSPSSFGDNGLEDSHAIKRLSQLATNACQLSAAVAALRKSR